jgi:CheY-like chemotaxis protein
MARILVVDDEPETRLTVEKMLRSAGHEVVLAGGGREGLQQFRANPPDLFIVDLFMPELDGLEAILALRREFPGVKVIAMSGNIAAEPMLSVARRLATVAVLEKPFSLPQLLATVDKAMLQKPV